MTTNKGASLLVLYWLLIACVTAHAEDKFVLKFATIAPEGTTWMNTMNEMNNEIKKASGDRLSVRFYPGGIMGDELVVLRKMRINQLQGGGFSGVGLGDILPDIRILDLPYLFRNNNEVDYIQNTLFDKFKAAYEQKGFVLLGWADVGFVHLFSKTDIDGVDALRRTKLWVWQDDPIAQAIFQGMGIATVPLAVTDVLTSLQVGMIDTVYSPPLGALALQWYTRVKYMMSFPLTHSTGAVLVSKKFYDKLPPDLQTILKEQFAKYLKILVERSRQDNEAAIETLKKNGIIVTDIPEPKILELVALSKAACNTLGGKLYSKELYNEVITLLEKYRNEKKQ